STKPLNKPGKPGPTIPNCRMLPYPVVNNDSARERHRLQAPASPGVRNPYTPTHHAAFHLTGLPPVATNTRPMKTAAPKYRRILLKLSGEALGGESGTGISPEAVHDMAR